MLKLTEKEKFSACMGVLAAFGALLVLSLWAEMLADLKSLIQIDRGRLKKSVILFSGGAVVYCIYRLRKNQKAEHQTIKAVAQCKNAALQYQGAVTDEVYSRADLNRSNAFKRTCEGFRILNRTIPGIMPDAQRIDDTRDVSDGVGGIDIMEAMTGMERGVFCGGTRHGKTFAAKQFAYRLLQAGHEIYALDPKFQDVRDPWPKGVRIFGSGDRYDQMEFCFDMIDAMANQRGRDIYNLDHYAPVSIFFDELLVTLDEVPELGPRYIKVLTKFGQYKIGIFVITQNDTAGDLGLQRRAKLKSCFDFVSTYACDKQRNIRKSFVKFNYEPNFMTHFSPGRECRPFKPEKFRPAISHSYEGSPDVCHDIYEHDTMTGKNTHDMSISGGKQSWHDKHDKPMIPGVTGLSQSVMRDNHYEHDSHGKSSHDSEQIIRKMFQEGASLSAMAREYFGRQNINGRDTNRIKAILQDTGLM